jgi:hypothetical protein
MNSQGLDLRPGVDRPVTRLVAAPDGTTVAFDPNGPNLHFTTITIPNDEDAPNQPNFSTVVTDMSGFSPMATDGATLVGRRDGAIWELESLPREARLAVCEKPEDFLRVIQPGDPLPDRFDERLFEYCTSPHFDAGELMEALNRLGCVGRILALFSREDQSARLRQAAMKVTELHLTEMGFEFTRAMIGYFETAQGMKSGEKRTTAWRMRFCLWIESGTPRFAMRWSAIARIELCT